MVWHHFGFGCFGRVIVVLATLVVVFMVVSNISSTETRCLLWYSFCYQCIPNTFILWLLTINIIPRIHHRSILYSEFIIDQYYAQNSSLINTIPRIYHRSILYSEFIIDQYYTQNSSSINTIPRIHHRSILYSEFIIDQYYTQNSSSNNTIPRIHHRSVLYSEFIIN